MMRVPSFHKIVDSSTSEMAIKMMKMYKARPDAVKNFKEEL